jgi:hypothetical protein
MIKTLVNQFSRPFHVIFWPLALMGCAGPYHPFGSHDQLFQSQKKSEKPVRNLAHVSHHSQAKIKFTPEKQNLHGPEQFSIIIEDPSEVLSTSQVNILYNGKNITKSFLEFGRIEISDNHQKMFFHFNHLRLSPSRENAILVDYQRDHFTEKVFAYYQLPDCPFREIEPLLSLSILS